MKIKIYQIKENKRELMFFDYKTAKEKGLFLADYELVYECERPEDYNTEDLYTEFNINRPEDFKGHSLSVSDIVEFGEGNLLYCDKIGWVTVDEEFKTIDLLTPPISYLKRCTPGKYEALEEKISEILSGDEEKIEELGEKFFSIFTNELATDAEPQGNSFSTILARYINGSERDKSVIEQTFVNLCGYGLCSLMDFTLEK